MPKPEMSRFVHPPNWTVKRALIAHRAAGPPSSVEQFDACIAVKHGNVRHGTRISMRASRAAIRDQLAKAEAEMDSASKSQRPQSRSTLLSQERTRARRVNTAQDGPATGGLFCAAKETPAAAGVFAAGEVSIFRC